jgi:hypothetical protein
VNLAAILLPLIPGLIQAVMQIVKAIESHDETPDVAKAQLLDIALRLDETAKRVAAIDVS